MTSTRSGSGRVAPVALMPEARATAAADLKLASFPFRVGRDLRLLREGDVIIVGTSRSRHVFKFRAR